MRVEQPVCELTQRIAANDVIWVWRSCEIKNDRLHVLSTLSARFGQTIFARVLNRFDIRLHVKFGLAAIVAHIADLPEYGAFPPGPVMHATD
jgi:hypothetical protein